MLENLPLLSKFAIGMAMILLLPKAMERVKLPGVLGFILAGALLGPGGLQVIKAEAPALHLLGEVGKVLFMFFVGFEIDLEQFNKSRSRAAIFGFLTAALPATITFFLCRNLGFDLNVSVLVGSVVASHTLLAFPILGKYELLSRNAVVVAIGGTIFTDIAAMIVLALCVSVHQSGFSWNFLLIEALELALFVPLIIFGFSKIVRKMVIHFGGAKESRVMILLVVIAVAAELGSLINLEGIVGAFLVGISVRRAMPGKFLVEQLEVVAHSLFIPIFFVLTGCLVDMSLLIETIGSAPVVVCGLICALIVGKFLAAFVTGKLFAYSSADISLIFTLTVPQMAATLASAVVGYNTMNGDGERLLGIEFVNAVIVLVIITSALGPIFTEIIARRFKKEPDKTKG